MTDRTVKTTLKGDVSDYQRAMLAASASTKAFVNELDTSNDRAALLTQSLLAIAPAAVPIGGAVVPAISGLTNQLAFAAAGAGVMVLAFQGVGDALKATNDYAITPTESNLQKMNQALAEIGPAGRDLVAFLQEIRPQLQDLQDTAQAGLFPGVEAGIRDLMTRMPEVERIVSTIAKTTGDLFAEGGQNLADPRWNKFFTFLEAEARPALLNLTRSLGNLGEGFANLWMAFDPVSDDFSDGFLQMSRDFAQWTDQLDDTKGFQDFLDYIERTGPKVWDTLGAIGNALVEIVEAAAPVGEAALPAIEGIADAVAAVANSDVGPAIIGIASLTSAYSRLIALSKTANSSAIGGLFSKSYYAGAASSLRDLPRAVLQYDAAAGRAQAKVGQLATSTGRLGDAARGAAKVAGGAGGLAFVLSGLDEKAGLSNTAMLGLAGSVAGPLGAAIGSGIGLVKDFASANDDMWAAIDRANKVIGDGTAPLEEQRAALDEARKQVDELSDATDGFVDRYSLKGIKNGFEGIFGKSDVEEATEAYNKAADAYEKNAEAAVVSRLAEAGLGEALQGTTADTREQVDAVLQLIQARNDMADQALEAADAELRYERALDAAQEAAAKGKDTLDKDTKAGQDNRQALYDLASAWNDLTPAQQNAEGASERARKSFIQAAIDMGANRQKAEALADKYLEIPTDVSTDVHLNNVDPAINKASALRQALLAIPNITETTIRTIEETYSVPKKSKSDPKPSLPKMLTPYTGMRIPAGYAAGGQPQFSGRVPGTPPTEPTEDNVFAMTQNGGLLKVRSREWIINEPQSDKNDRWLRAINNGLNLDDIFGRAPVPGLVSGGRYEDFSALTKSSKLDIERQKLRIRDIEDSLNEKETVGKGKDKRKRDSLRGQARRVAQLELSEAKADLAKMRSDNAKLKGYGTQDQEEAARDVVEEAERVVKDAADRFVSTKSDAASLFTIGSSTSAAQIDRNLNRLLADANTFLGLLGDLKGKGASPWLLGELVKAGPTPGAIRLAREYNTNQGALDSINQRASQIDQYTNAYAGLVSNSQFMQAQPWNSGISSATQAPVVASLVGAEISVGSDGLMTFVNGQIVVAQDSQIIDMRTTP